MTHQIPKIQETTAFSPEAGEWMYFPQAMDATGLTERSLRRYMQTKQVRYRKLGKSANARVQLFITDELRKIRLKDTQEEESSISSFTDVEFDASPIDIEEEEYSQEQDNSWLATERERVRMLAQEMMAPLLSTIREQERLIQDQNRQLLLLPDLHKKAEEERKSAEMRELEVNALQKQIAALQSQMTEEQKEFQKQANEKAMLASEIESLKKDLESKVAETEKKPWWKSWFGIE